MIFHLAIPCRDLVEAEAFYTGIGAKVGRKYKTHIIVSFGGHQLVCHLSDDWDKEVTMYPRHFGLLIDDKMALYKIWMEVKGQPFVFKGYFVRRRGETAEHHTFFLKDPSNNLIEFKWYKNENAIF